jgi:hypothetical protein
VSWRWRTARPHCAFTAQNCLGHEGLSIQISFSCLRAQKYRVISSYLLCVYAQGFQSRQTMYHTHYRSTCMAICHSALRKHGDVFQRSTTNVTLDAAEFEESIPIFLKPVGPASPMTPNDQSASREQRSHHAHVACSSVVHMMGLILCRRRAVFGVRKPERRFPAPSIKRTRNTFQNAIKYLSLNEFQRAFRTTLPIFGQLHILLHGDLFKDDEMARRSSGGRVEPGVRLGLTLRILAGASYHDLMMLFHLGRSTIFGICFRTVPAITKRLRLSGIPLDNEDLLNEIATGFAHSRDGGSPLFGCVGAVDGIAIKIQKPHDEDNPASYFCRKGFYSVPVQAVVDSN